MKGSTYTSLDKKSTNYDNKLTGNKKDIYLSTNVFRFTFLKGLNYSDKDL